MFSCQRTSAAAREIVVAAIRPAVASELSIALNLPPGTALLSAEEERQTEAEEQLVTAEEQLVIKAEERLVAAEEQLVEAAERRAAAKERQVVAK